MRVADLGKSQGSQGSALIEVMTGMILFLVVSTALLPLISSGIRLQADARNASVAHSLGRGLIEELWAAPRADARLDIGGDLASNVADHFDQPAGTPYTRRWVVEAGPAGTLLVTVTVVSDNDNVRFAPFEFTALLPE